MALGATVATAFNGGLPNRAWGFYVDGRDISGAVDWATVDLHISGAGSASFMRWQVDDLGKAYTFSEGQEVRLERLGQAGLGSAVSAPWFRGTLEIAEPTTPGVGRIWSLTATGVDALPDWLVTDYDVTSQDPSGVQWDLCVIIQALATACPNRGALNIVGGLAAPVQGTVDNPIGSLEPIPGGTGINAPQSTVVVPAGTSLRRAVEMVAAQCVDVNDPSIKCPPIRLTVDMYFGLRAYLGGAPYVAPDANLSVTLGPATTPPTADDQYRRDGTTVIRRATVVGTGVRASASDGSGKLGRSAVVSDPSITTAAQAQSAAAAYVASHGAAVRGRVSGESYPTGTAEASWVLRRFVLTDAELGSTGAYELGGLDVTFDGAGRPTIAYTYGGLAQSAADLIRRQAGQPLLA